MNARGHDDDVVIRVHSMLPRATNGKCSLPKSAMLKTNQTQHSSKGNKSPKRKKNVESIQGLPLCTFQVVSYFGDPGGMRLSHASHGCSS